jgi:hypothetical protein
LPIATKAGAEIHYRGDLDIAALRKAVAGDGYVVAEGDCGPATGRAGNTPRDYMPDRSHSSSSSPLSCSRCGNSIFCRAGLGVSDTMSYGLVFLIGLVASVSSCIAVTGGLLVAAAAKYNEANRRASGPAATESR